eukprot:2527981-Pleurochrysis_carterae.AAC.2
MSPLHQRARACTQPRRPSTRIRASAPFPPASIAGLSWDPSPAQPVRLEHVLPRTGARLRRRA